MEGTTSMDRVAGLLSNKDGQENYLEWLKSDVTQMLLAASRELAHPNMNSVADASVALHENGRIIGAYQVLDFLCDPQKRAAVSQTGIDVTQKENPLKPTYGAEEILKETAHE
jgi:hypothetical protein